MASPYLTRLQNLAAKIEVTEGTDESPADADVIAPALDIEPALTVDVPDRAPLSASFDRPTQISGEQSGVVTFTTELKGSGVDPVSAATAPPHLSALLQACGMKETINAGVSVVYTPQSQDPKTVTIEIRQSPRDSSDPVRVVKILGARGTFRLVGVKGQIVAVEFEFTGKYVEPDTDGAVSQYTNAVVTPQPVPLLNAALTFQGAGALVASEVSIDLANTVSLRNDISDSTGNSMAEIVDRVITGSFNPEIGPDSVKSFWNQLTTDAEGILQYVLGATAGNITTVKCPKAQLVGIAQSDLDGRLIEAFDLRCNRDADAGDDALSITFT